jgi:hypothetical protein
VSFPVGPKEIKNVGGINPLIKRQERHSTQISLQTKLEVNEIPQGEGKKGTATGETGGLHLT